MANDVKLRNKQIIKNRDRKKKGECPPRSRGVLLYRKGKGSVPGLTYDQKKERAPSTTVNNDRQLTMSGPYEKGEQKERAGGASGRLRLEFV